jgi:dipeptidyl-peptidase 4
MLSSHTLQAQSARLTLEDIFQKEKYTAAYGPHIHFSADNTSYIIYRDNGIRQFGMDGKLIRTLLTQQAFKDHVNKAGAYFDGYEVWPGGKLLLKSNTASIYRYSTMSDHIIYDVEGQQWHPIPDTRKTMYPTLSPDGKHVAYVSGNNIFLYHLESRQVLPVTSDGAPNAMINGRSDWVYEEEFDLTSAMVWTADSRYLAYLRFDERGVPEYFLDVSAEDLHPDSLIYRYPHPGDPNAVVSLHTYDLHTGQTLQLPLEAQTEYVPRLYAFSDPGKIFTLQLDRRQLRLQLVAHNIPGGHAVVWLEEEDERYVELPIYLNVDAGGRTAITSEREGYQHLYLSDPNRTHWQDMSPGDRDITAVYGADSLGRWYLQRVKDNGISREIFRISPEGEEVMLFSGGMVEAQFSPDFSTALLRRSDIHSPYEVSLMEVSTGKKLSQLTASPKVKSAVESTGVTIEFITIPAKGQEMNAWIMKPSVGTKCKKHPVLFTVYGGPWSQHVLNQWGGDEMMWYRYLAQQGYFVVAVDGRGTPGRGTAFRKSIHGRFGDIDAGDIMAAARVVAGFRNVDSKRMGIMGWSYGGYMALMCLLQENNPFKAGIAIAPVTHWHWYDNIYTERYMGLPAENREAYERSAPVNRADKLKGKLLLVHGTADDNVHVRHTLEMANALDKVGKSYELMLFRGANHNMDKEDARYQLYSRITAFLLKGLR